MRFFHFFCELFSHEAVIEVFRLLLLDFLENCFLMGDLRLRFAELYVGFVDLLIYALACPIRNLMHRFSVTDYRVLRFVKLVSFFVIITQYGEIGSSNLLSRLVFFTNLWLHVYYGFTNNLLTRHNHDTTWFCTYNLFYWLQLTVLKVHSLLLVSIDAGIVVKLATWANFYYFTLIERRQILVAHLICIYAETRLTAKDFTSIQRFKLVRLFLIGVFHLCLIPKLVWVLNDTIFGLSILWLYPCQKVSLMWIISILYVFSLLRLWFEIFLDLLVLALYECVFLFHLFCFKL